MKARMRRLSVSIDSSSIPHHHLSPEVKSAEVSSTESRIDRVKKLLSSPLLRRKSASATPSSLSFGSFSSSTTAYPASGGKVFGMPLSLLARVDPPQKVDPSQTSLKQPGIPYVISRLCNFIENHESGLTHEGLFRIPANFKHVERLKHSFDDSGDAPLEESGDVASAAALVKLFLRELPEPVIPTHLNQPFFAAFRDYELSERNGIERMRALVAVLPTENFFVLKYLCSFLHRVCLYESQNRMNSSSLGICFGPNFFRLSPEDYKEMKDLDEEISYANQVADVFISQHAHIFDQEIFDTIRQESSFVNRAPVTSTPPTKKHSLLGIKRKSSGPPTLQNSYNHIIPILILSNDVLSPSIRAKAFPKGPLSTLKQRRQSKLLGADIAGGYMPCRSHSEERPSPSDSSASPDFLDIRRCNSTEEVLISPSIPASAFFTSIPESEHPETPKEKNFPTELSEQLDVSPSRQEVQVQVTVDDDDVDPVNVTLRTNPDRKRRLSAIASCKMAQFQADGRQWKCIDEDDVTHTDDVNNNESRESPNLLDCDKEKDDADSPTTTSDIDCLSVPISFMEHRNSWPRDGNKESHLPESSSDLYLSSFPLSCEPWTRGQTGHVSEAPVSPSAYRSYLSMRAKRLSDPSVAPSPPLEGDEYPVKSNRLSRRDVKRKIQSLKKSLKTFEEDFETRTGRKASIEDKTTCPSSRAIMLEILRLKKGVKDSFDVLDEDDFFSLSQTFLLSPDGDRKIDPKMLEDAFKRLQETLDHQRKTSGRPDDFEDMVQEQIIAEKLELQKALLKFESIYGRPSNKRDRDIVRPLYERYRNAKRALARIHSSSKEQSLSDLQPILEHVVMSFPTSSSSNSKEEPKEEPKEELSVQRDFLINKEDEKMSSHQIIEENLHELPLGDLKDHILQSRTEKRKLRRVIKSFEEDLTKRLGRKVEKEDKVHLEPVYMSYKQVKGKLRLLEALVSKSEKGQYKI